MTKLREPKILYYDCETSPLKAWIWRLGDQVVRHDQLDKNFSSFDIICITYCWNDNKPGKVLSWLTHTPEQMILEFDKLVKQADITIGKNNKNFDDRRVNTQRMMLGLPPLPDWIGSTDDLERQMRKYFTFPSHSLDYVMKLITKQGKIKMDFQDWIDIMEGSVLNPKTRRYSFNKKALKALKKMCKYGKKDATDTRIMFNKFRPYIKPKLNLSALYGLKCCTNCGSTNIVKSGTRVSGKVKYQMYSCNDHKGYAGKHPYSTKTEILGS